MKEIGVIDYEIICFLLDWTTSEVRGILRYPG